ncbi:hypothetical protein [Micromonospora sp. KC606]|uniref:hypothetical protein n=1 Tax=Micromonospora sp. KC606 TaxID=2530379 RepID=UPI001FB61695|nr:hypothetical protein [Micromonospora sp. KC606]
MELTPLGRQLLDELGPAYAQVQTAIVRAIATGHGTTCELHLGYMSAAIARRVLPLVDAFHAAIAHGPTFDHAIVWRTGDLTALASAFVHQGRDRGRGGVVADRWRRTHDARQSAPVAVRDSP